MADQTQPWAERTVEVPPQSDAGIPAQRDPYRRGVASVGAVCADLDESGAQQPVDRGHPGVRADQLRRRRFAAADRGEQRLPSGPGLGGLLYAGAGEDVDQHLAEAERIVPVFVRPRPVPTVDHRVEGGAYPDGVGGGEPDQPVQDPVQRRAVVLGAEQRGDLLGQLVDVGYRLGRRGGRRRGGQVVAA
ncbi:hypothetical protein EYA84_31390, partial [Verrucosispora sp. SN26_14.1]